MSLKPCLAAVAPLGVCEVRKLLSGVVSFGRQWRCLFRSGLSVSFIDKHLEIRCQHAQDTFIIQSFFVVLVELVTHTQNIFTNSNRIIVMF